MGWHLRLARVAIPAGCVLAATVLCWLLQRLTGSRVPFMFFIPAVLLATWYGGLLVGIAALAVGYVLGDVYFLHGPGAMEHHGPDEVMFLWVYTLTTLTSVLLLEGLRRFHSQLRSRNQQLEQEMAERRLAEQTLAEAEAKYRSLVEESLVGVYLIQNGHFLYTNARLAEIFGYAPGEVQGRPVGDLVADQDRATVVENVRKREAGEMQRIHYAFHGIRKDGQIIDVEVIGSSTLFRGRRAVLGTLLDMTQRKRAEEAMRLSEERFRRTFDESPIGAAIITLDRHHRQVNEMFCQMTGYSREELAGLRIEDITHPDDVARDKDAAARMARGEIERFETDKRYIRKDGTTFWAHVSARLLRDAAGQPLCFLPMMQDVTARRVAEEQLRDAKAAAEAANRAKDHFLAVLSHELRTPLSAVIPALEALGTMVPPEAAEYLAMAHRNAELEARLIDDLLDVTRIARGKVELDRQLLDLGAIVRRAADVCHADIEGRRLHFAVHVADGPYWVNGDAARLQQVFWNLIKNAVKFTPAGGCVGVRCQCAGNRVTVAVSDSGVGIEAAAIARIFNAFEQESRASTRQFGGLGLGLAISKAMVELHGGAIEVHSEGKGKGATFTVELPLASVPAPGEGPAAPAAMPAVSASRKLRILLVEDHGDTACILSRLFTARGHTVEHAGAVATARELIQQGTFDVLVSDLGLPDGSGHDLMRQLAAEGRCLPAIALSGYGMAADVQKSREAGFIEHMTKPVNFEALLATVTRVAGEVPPRHPECRQHRGERGSG